MNNLKHGWNYKKLNELGFIGRGKSKHRPRNDSSLYGGCYPFIQTGDVKAADLYISEYSQTYNEKGLAQSKLWEPDTLLITIAANIAETSILKIKACFPDSIVGFIADPNKSDVRFIKYYIDTVKFHMQSVSRGTTQDNLSLEKLLTFKFLTPKIQTQQRIADILSNYDRLIENNTRRIKILEEMARSLYDEWFVKFRFPGYEQTKMVDSELGLIPEGWNIKILRDLCEQVNYGYTASAKTENTGIKLLRITDIVPYTIDWDSVPYCQIPNDKLHKYKLEEGDIVIARTGATTGYAKRINKRHPESVFASYLVRIRVNKQLTNSHYIGIVVESDKYRQFIKTNLTGAAQPQANAQVLTSFSILLPSEKIQNGFREIVNNFFDQRETLQLKNLNLRKTRDLLLPKLISGEIDVEDLDIETGIINENEEVSNSSQEAIAG